MGNISFGQLLEKLMHLSDQKKSLLAKELGYDISYISKWINSKNLPSTKNINKICKTIANFIVEQSDEHTMEEIINYFEINISQEVDKKSFLSEYIERALKESYIDATGDTSVNMVKETYSQEGYNSISHINPKLRKKYLYNELLNYLEKCNESTDIIIYYNLSSITKREKITLFHKKSILHNLKGSNNLNIKFLTSLDYKGEKDVLLSYLVLINMVSSCPSLNFEMYNCNISPNIAIYTIKNNIFYLGVSKTDGSALFTNMSKEKRVVNEFYYSIEDTIKMQGNPVCEKKNTELMIKDNTYMEYIMGHDLRWIIGGMNELFMPEDLFEEVAESIFGDNEEAINELKQINIFLQNVTYKSKLRVLIYESELRKYISSGELTFFGIPTIFSFKQRERHIKYLEKILKESNDVEVRLIEGKLINELNITENTSIFLSKNLKFIKTNPQKIDKKFEYAIIIDDEFKNICNDLFEKIWEERKDIVSDDRSYIIDRISKAISYISVINEKIQEK